MGTTVEREQCRIVTIGGGPFQVRHSKDCSAEYCQAEFQAECLNRKMRRHVQIS